MNPEELISLLRNYDVPVDPSKIKALFEEDRATALVEWTRSHLTPDTLLSVDELQLFTALEKSGKAEQLAASADLATVQARDDKEIKEAIKELNRSTQAITKQTKALGQQQDALNRLVTDSRKDSDARADLEQRHAQTRVAGQKSAASDREDIVQSLHLRLAELDQQTTRAGKGIEHFVEDMFRADDRLLASLQKLGCELETEDPAEQANIVKLRDICVRLIKCNVEIIRAKLDRHYLESLEPSSRSSAPPIQVEDMAAVKEELDSLYLEILPVAQMSVEQQYLQPALKAISTKRGNSSLRSEQGVAYILECLDYLLHRIDTSQARISTFQSYQAALTALTDIARVQLATKIERTAKKERRPTVGASPVRRRKSSGNLSMSSPSRPWANSRVRRSSNGAGKDESPLEELLRSLSIIPSSVDGATSNDAQVRCLISTLQDRSRKAQDVALNVQQSVESASIAQLTDATLAVQMLRDSILAESPYGEVKLIDPEMDESIVVLARQLEEVRQSAEARGAGSASAGAKSVKREELVRRWGP